MRFDELPVGAWFTFSDDYPIGGVVDAYQKRENKWCRYAWSATTETGSMVRADEEVTACEHV